MKEGAVNGSFPAQNSASELHSAKGGTWFCVRMRPDECALSVCEPHSATLNPIQHPLQ
jgi:hypothetical protein